jgi:hypothetical protein
MRAEFGWTVVARGGDPKKLHVYKRDCPPDAQHHAADLAPFTFPSKAKAIEAGKDGVFAYKRVQLPDGGTRVARDATECKFPSAP